MKDFTSGSLVWIGLIWSTPFPLRRGRSLGIGESGSDKAGMWEQVFAAPETRLLTSNAESLL